MLSVRTPKVDFVLYDEDVAFGDIEVRVTAMNGEAFLIDKARGFFYIRMAGTRLTAILVAVPLLVVPIGQQAECHW